MTIAGKICRVCRIEKVAADFSRDTRAHDGLQSACKPCQKVGAKEWRRLNPDYASTKGVTRYTLIGHLENGERYERNRPAYRARQDLFLRTVRGRLYSLVNSAACRSRKVGMVCDIDLDWALALWSRQDGCCALTGIPMTLERNPNGERFYMPFSPSLDRILASGGYTRDNVRLVCVIVNLALNRFGDGPFGEMCLAYAGRLKRETVRAA